jgi:uncharacterized protein (TIGR03435 family)
MSSRAAVGCAVLVAAASGPGLRLFAQQPAPPAQPAAAPAFEVASVKPNRTATALPRFEAAPGRYSWTAFTVKSLIDVAFQRNAFDHREAIGGPDWIDKDRFDLVVQASAGAVMSDPDGFPGPVFAMVRSVLAERFGLVAHNEVRERPVYALGVARTDRRLGDGLTRTESDCQEAVRRMTAPTPGARPPGPPPCSFGGGPGRIQGNIVSLAMLANILGRTVGRPVIDRTGVEGYFNVTLEYAPEAGIVGPLPPGVPPQEPPPARDAPSLFTAVQEQLGLKLDSTRAPVDILVIDRLSQPTEN